jgi:hypothetical protein
MLMSSGDCCGADFGVCPGFSQVASTGRGVCIPPSALSPPDVMERIHSVRQVPMPVGLSWGSPAVQRLF